VGPFELPDFAGPHAGEDADQEAQIDVRLHEIPPGCHTWMRFLQPVNSGCFNNSASSNASRESKLIGQGLFNRVNAKERIALLHALTRWMYGLQQTTGLSRKGRRQLDASRSLPV
jgi:hypothetical protein